MAKANSFLQLNGYKSDKAFFRYFKTDFSAFAIVFFAIDIVFFVVFSGLWIFVHAGLCVLLWIKYRCENKKTPLRYTWRIKRLVFVEWLILFGLSFVFKPIVWLLLPFVAVFANAINQPIESCIQAGFIQKAKIKLASCPKVKVVAITGSYAKTSVKNILSEMLSKEYKVVKTPASFNTPMGIAKTINDANFDDVDFFVCEMGARRKGEIAELCSFVRPDVSVITGISKQHLQTFGSIDNIIKTKCEIISGTKEGGVVVLNDDCPFLREIKTDGCFWSGEGSHCNLSYADVRCERYGTYFNLSVDGQKLPCKTKLLGVHNVSNICLSALVGHILGLKWQSVIETIGDLQYTPHRLELIEGEGGFYILDDSFNANPDGVMHAIDLLDRFVGKKIVVMSGIVDCGKSQREINEKIGEYLAKRCDFVFLVGINSKSIMQGLLNMDFNAEKIFCCDSVQDASVMAAKYLRADDVILFCNDLPDNFV